MSKIVKAEKFYVCKLDSAYFSFYFDNTRILGAILNAISYFRICKCHHKMQCYLKYEKVSFLVK